MSLIIGVMPKFLWVFFSLREFLFWDISLTDVVKCGKQFFFCSNWIFVIGAGEFVCLNVCIHVQIKRGLKGE